MDIINKLLKKSSKGFTLVELLVVIAIIGILATLLLLQLGTARGKARDAKRVSDLNQVASALELFYDDYGYYPRGGNDLSLAPPTGLSKYIKLLPVDPSTTGCTKTYTGNNGSTGGCYGYATSSGANPIKYHIWARLEQFNKGALENDIDFNSSGWDGGPINGTTAETTATCSGDITTANSSCIYDVGQTN